MGTTTAAVVDGRIVSLRPVAAGDRAFLLEVYAAGRAEELAQVDWSEADKRAFLGMQFEAQDRHYREHYPEATFAVVLVDGEPAGRLYVQRWPEEIRIVDIALLPAYRNAGVGTRLLAAVMEEATTSARTLSIHVERFNPALRLYDRLGFVPVADRGVYVLMEFRGRDGHGTHET